MKKIWLLGFGFFSISITWSLYNAFVPFFLEKYVHSVALISFMMTIDNYFALFLQPWIGNRSDRTSTRYGRRMPYLLAGMPLAAILTMLIPYHSGLFTLLLFMMLMNLAMSLYRSPTVALMPDITPDAQRTKANGLINFMGGAGSILAFGVGSILYNTSPALPFIAAGVITLLCLLIVSRFIKESRDGVNQPAAAAEGSILPLGKPARISVKRQLDRTTVWLLAAIFFWFVAYQGVETLFTLYGKHHLGLSEQAASFSLTFFSLAFVIFAIPSGWLGSRFGKKTMIITGVCGLMAVFALVGFADNLLVLRGLLLLGGMFWACININSYPYVVATGNEESIGTRTGMYYLVSSLAAITSPPLLGLMIDLTDYSILFYAAAASMACALFCLLRMKAVPRNPGV
ncbi:SLC45 family MFS transporter [Paenibacillus sp. MMS20-IR301]|uniref:SLC45 family MFS transporter n=1 Tax=Paenibacillus sp. MMS20-IR301 TaxID=2895946 RepID=UPI0028EA2AC7|nr:SLC45 family MFS transporter [Paenibacillus sp. MMS20-IR301]WNS41159.1 SLC45 family MFS transporter [Paenibacillus sp. MMS20-IR301]